MKRQRSTIKLFEFEDFLWIPNFMYKGMGYDFLQMRKPKWLRNLLHIYLVLTTSSHFFCKFNLYRQFYRVIRDVDVINIIPTATYVSYSIDSNIKFLTFAINHRRVSKICQTLREAYPQTARDRRIYRVHEHYWSWQVRFLFVYCGLACAVVILSPLVESVFLYVRDIYLLGYDETRFHYLKPFPMPYDFNHKTPYGYMLAYIIEILNSLFTGNGNIGTDLWLMCYTMQLCMHLEYIARMLQEYEPHVENTRKDCAFLAELIRKHQMVFSLLEELNTIFGLSLVFTILSTANSLCILSVQLIFQGMGADFLQFCAFLASYAAQFYMVCHYGQKLIDVSQQVSMAAYNSRWYDGSREYKKLLLIVIVRAQKQASLMAKGFQPISLDTFKIVMRMTYRVFAVVRTVLEN